MNTAGSSAHDAHISLDYLTLFSVDVNDRPTAGVDSKWLGQNGQEQPILPLGSHDDFVVNDSGKNDSRKRAPTLRAGVTRSHEPLAPEDNVISRPPMSTKCVM